MGRCRLSGQGQYRPRGCAQADSAILFGSPKKFSVVMDFFKNEIMSMVFFLFSLLGSGLLLLTAFFLELRSAKKLKQALEEKTMAFDQTSKLLIEKSIELLDQNLRLQKLLEAKTDFIDIASHQLRTPATEVKWGIDVLREGTLGTLSDTQHAHLEKLFRATEKMIRLIDDLLKMVSVEEGFKKIMIAPYPFDELVEIILEHVRTHFINRKIVVIKDLRCRTSVMSIDAEAMRMVFFNLIENAFYYTPPGGTITVKSAIQDNTHIYFEVQDTGIGIQQQKQHSIFQKFKRGEIAAHMNAGGIGLGLYIAKNIVKQHRGQINFQSQEGKGTMFHFSIPLR